VLHHQSSELLPDRYFAKSHQPLHLLLFFRGTREFPIGLDDIREARGTLSAPALQVQGATFCDHILRQVAGHFLYAVKC